MDSISNLFRINLITVSSDSLNGICDISLILKNYYLVTDLERLTFRDFTSSTALPISQLRLRIRNAEEAKNQYDPATIQNLLFQEVYQESIKYQLSDILEIDETPWYEKWKDRFISTHSTNEHDFISSNFGAFIFLSTNDLQSFDSITSKLLSQIRNDTYLKFMTTSFIEHFVIVNVINHDDPRPESADTDPNYIPPCYSSIYSRFTNCFGLSNCSWLNIDLAQPDDNILAFLKGFIYVSLVPWCERQVRLLNDAISTRKGLRRNLVIATRQLLNMGQTSYANQSVFYTQDAGEMKCRKLGDIAMCLGLYDLAASSYDLAKKEFLNDNAWLYYAGACESYAASMFMLNKFQKSHIEKALTVYVEPCKNFALATRATILATDMLRQTNPLDAAKFFQSLTGNNSDLQSALFLEQASKCFIDSRCRMRKGAFYYVLAGYRYSRCNLVNLSLRCYAQFDAKDWTAATDYVKLSSKHITNQIAAESSQPSQGDIDEKVSETIKNSSSYSTSQDI